MPRILIEKALEIVEKDSSKDIVPHLIIEAPTGYGKSVAAPLIASTMIRNGVSYGFIHSLPLRAIVRDLYLCLLINSLTNDAELRRECRKSEEVLREVAEALTSVGIGADEVAYQMGDLIFSRDELLKKEPLFNARYVVTTLDSLAYNAFRVPLTEIFNPRKHYATPRLRIFLSTLYIDEAHMIYEEEGDNSKITTIFKSLMEMVKAGNIPLVIASATLSEGIEKEIISDLRTVKVIKLSNKEGIEGNYVYVRDKDFEDFIRSVNWVTNFIEEHELVKKVSELINSGLRVFIARDTVCSAISTYITLRNNLELRDGEIVLLHSLMSRSDREEAHSKLSSGRVKILVATSVVEAGVDLSFDVLITDAGRPASIIQRVGRVCRTPTTCKSQEALIYLMKNEHMIKDVFDFVNNVKQNNKEVGWRLPYDVDNYTSYITLLNNIKTEIKVDGELLRRLKGLTNPLLISGQTINQILKNMDYALTRVHLVEVLIRRPDTSKLNHSKLDKDSMVTNIEKLAFLTRRGCIESLYIVRDNAEIEERKILNDSFKSRELESRLLKKYIEIMLNPELRYRTSKIAYLLKDSCYTKGLGVKYEVLCLQEGK